MAALVAATAAVAGETVVEAESAAPASAAEPLAVDAGAGNAAAVRGAPSNDRLALGLGIGVFGSLHVNGDSEGFSDGTTVAVHAEYGHVMGGWFELGLGMHVQQSRGFSLDAYRPYASMRAFTTSGSTELGLALRAGPSFFHFTTGGRAYDASSFAPSLVFDARAWVTPTFAVVGGIELLASGAAVAAPPGPDGYVARSQLWDTVAIASVGLAVRL